jgi:hypothetical protein
MIKLSRNEAVILCRIKRMLNSKFEPKNTREEIRLIDQWLAAYSDAVGRELARSAGLFSRGRA